MYIYFDKNGTIQEIINDESIRKGSNDYNKIYCYLEGNPDIDDIWYLQKNPDGTLTNEVSFVDNIVTKAIPYDSHRDMKYFQDFEEYQFYVFTLSSSYLLQSGLVVATIRVAENNTLWALGELTFNVQANVINSDNGITQSQYDYLLTIISAYYSKTEIDNKLNLKADKSDTYTKAQVDNRLSLKADKSNTYTKTESDNTFASKSTAITHTGNQLQDYSGNNIYPVLENNSIVYEELNGSLEKGYKIEETILLATFQAGGLWNIAGYNKGYIGGSSSHSYIDVSVQYGQTYYIKTQNDSAYLSYCFYDSNNDAIDYYGTENSGDYLFDGDVRVPKNAVRMVVTFKNSYFNSFEVKEKNVIKSKTSYSNLDDKLKDVLTIDYSDLTISDWTYSKAFYYLNTYANPIGKVGNFGQTSITYVDVSNYTEILLKTLTGSTAICAYVLYDAYDNIVGYAAGNSSTDYTIYEISKPSNCVKIGICCLTASIGNMAIKGGTGVSINALKISLDNNYLIDGWDFMQHWYEKVYNLDNSKIVLDGDSITEGYASQYPGVDDAFINMRGYHIDKVMKCGKFPANKLTIINNGHGGRSSNEWVGNATYGNPTYIQQYPNGFLDVSMSENPDLLIICWGMNDADKTNTRLPATLEGRLQLYEDNMREGLKRIRGHISVNGRPSYNKTLADLSIIICNPTSCNIPSSDRTYNGWFKKLKAINIKLCEEFNCAFVDFSSITRFNGLTPVNTWAQLNADGTPSVIHPNKYQDAMVSSWLQPLIYPFAMWNITD